MIPFLTRTIVLPLFLLFTTLGFLLVPVRAQTGEPEAHLRFDQSTKTYYVAVYINSPPQGGLDQIRASLRDLGGNMKLISTTIAPPPSGDDSRFIFGLGTNKDEIFAHFSDYRVLVDSYPTASGGVEDHEIEVTLDVEIALTELPGCPGKTGILVRQTSHSAYGDARFADIVGFLDRNDVEHFITATVSQPPHLPESRNIRIEKPPAPSPGWCVEFESTPPAGAYTLKLEFSDSAPPELHNGTFTHDGTGPDVPSATDEKRSNEDFLDLGLTLTSSVEEEEQLDKTTKRVRTTRGVMDLFLAPILNMRKVKSHTNGGLVQVFTPFYIDSKISTGKITKDTLSLNRVELGSTYEFRQYRVKAYSDLFRHALSFKHNSDRDFKQDEVKFVYEFQPIWGKVNRPLGSAPNILDDEPVENITDKFGYEIVPIVGVELGRTYRVRDPKEFEGISRNVRRFYFGGAMTFGLTKYVQLSLQDLFYVRGENPKDRTENYFVGSIEAPLSRIRNLWAAHALFLSFERGEQAPFTNPSVNIFKFGYRIRARDLIR